MTIRTRAYSPAYLGREARQLAQKCTTAGCEAKPAEGFVVYQIIVADEVMVEHPRGWVELKVIWECANGHFQFVSERI